MSDSEASPPPGPEFSRRFMVEPGMGEGEDALHVNIKAEAPERAALAARFGLISIEALAVTGRLDVFARGCEARLTARLTADVTQACVVSLAPVRSHLEEDFVRDFDRASRADDETDFDMAVTDPPDPLPEAGIDVGEVAAEQLALALDPYPHAERATLKRSDAAGGEAQIRQESPFSVLSRLKGR